jgi:hypothetical protein
MNSRCVLNLYLRLVELRSRYTNTYQQVSAIDMFFTPCNNVLGRGRNRDRIPLAVRRYFDLALAPTLPWLGAFIDDKRPQANEQLVDLSKQHRWNLWIIATLMLKNTL